MTLREKLQEKTIANKLLADFDEIETQPIKEGDTILYDYRNNVIDYSDDWNMLMSCCKKIYNYSVANFTKIERITYWEQVKNIDNSITDGYNVNHCFTALIDIVKFLNSQKELQCTQPTS